MNRSPILVLLAACLIVTGVTGTVLAADTYTIDRAHSSVLFVVNHMVISKVKGEFNEFSGTIKHDEGDIANSSVDVTIKTASIDTKSERRDGHLRSPDFFDVEQHPEITFKSKKIEKTDAGLVAVGDLTMRGVTKEVRIPFEITGTITDPRGNRRMGISAKLTLNRQDYGVSWNQTLDAGGLVVSDDVGIEIELEAIKAD
jgi:polyisoprenoid-binding protein YceI